MIRLHLTLLASLFAIFFGSNLVADESNGQTDADIRQKIAGKWLIAISGEYKGDYYYEKGSILFESNGTYSAQATVGGSKDKTELRIWEGKWQITNSILTTPTTETTGFEEDFHPPTFIPKCKVVRVNENDLVCKLIVATNKVSPAGYSYKRAKN